LQRAVACWLLQGVGVGKSPDNSTRYVNFVYAKEPSPDRRLPGGYLN